MAQIDGEEHLARDDIRGIGSHLHQAYRSDGERRVRKRDRIHFFDDPGCAEKRVPPARHRRRAGMRILAGHRHLEPANALDAGADPDFLALSLKERALLDMQLEKSGERMLAAFLRAAVSDFLQSLG